MSVPCELPCVLLVFPEGARPWTNLSAVLVGAVQMVAKKQWRYNAKGRFDDVAFHLANDWLEHEKVTVREAATRLNSRAATVSYWVKKGQAPSLTVWQTPKPDKARLQKRRALVEQLVTTTEDVEGVRYTPVRKWARKRVVRRRPFGSAGCISRQICLTTGKPVSKSTILRDLRITRKPYVCGRGPRLTEANKVARVAFAKLQLSPKTKLDYSIVCFSDEKWFDSDDGRMWYWLRPGEYAPARQKERYGPKVMVWAVIGPGFRRIVRVPSSSTGKGAVKINEDVYTELITPVMKEMKKKKLMLQQDNAPGHAAAINHRWFEAHGVTRLGGWPANSPDLNPIETLWAILAARVSMRGPFGEDELWDFVEDEFHKVDEATVVGLCMSFRRRLGVSFAKA